MLIGAEVSEYWHFSGINAMVAACAQSNGYKVLEAKLWFLSLPSWGMLLTTSKSQTLMQVKMLDMSSHRIRTEYLRLGSYWRGVLDFDAVQVRWQDE